MALGSSVLGGAAFGLAARFWQLGIQKRNLFDNIGVHALFAGTFGYVGYWAHRWEVRSEELLAKKEAQIKENRRLRRLQDLERENARVLQHERELEDAQSA